MLRYRFLFEQMFRRELRRKYAGSALGVLWYVVNPLVLMGAYTLMFGLLFPQNIPDYSIFLMIGLIVWTFFQQSLMAAAPSLLDQSSLVRKARFPRETIPGAVVTVQLVTFAAVLLLLLPVAIAVRGKVGASLLLLPVLVALLFGFVLGCSLVVSILHAYFRDVAPVVAAALLPWFFISPIFFEPSQVPFVERHGWVGTMIEWVNPVAPFIEGMRRVVYDGAGPGWGRLGYAVAAAVLALGAGWFAFRRGDGELAVVV
ncbi:MAG: putative transporter permease protein [Solirubrobacterales bacterium]|nr:putative transporter permease protein [Solirubrobacterales bacterium]